MADLAAFPLNLDAKKRTCSVIIETPKGRRNKFDYDPDSNLFRLGGLLPEGMSFPFDFGFAPSTLGEDGDALDVMVLHQATSSPGIVMRCALLGAIAIVQTEGRKTVRNDRYILCPQKQDAEDAAISDE